MTRYSEVSYTYSGGSKVFTIPFSYLKTEHIHVFVDEEETANFEFNTTSQIQVNDELTSGQKVKITRITPANSRMVVFNDRSVLNAQQQNLDSEQIFNVVQEVYDKNLNFEDDIEDKFEDYKDVIDGNISTISDSVDTANTNASMAVTTANSAVSTANSANSKADTAVSTANTANTNASNAVTTANAANTAAGNAVSTANSANITATNASNKVDEFGEDIEDVLEAASKINELEQAVATAVSKAGEATTAATTANTKASEATTAAQTAQEAAESIVIPTTLSSFTDDLGSNPTHTHSQYVTDISGKEDIAKAINVLATSGTIALTDNSVNSIAGVTGNITFTLPTVTDNTTLHQIFVQMNMPTTAYTIDMGLGNTPHWLTEDEPDLTSTGNYNLYWEYDKAEQFWRGAALKKGAAS